MDKAVSTNPEYEKMSLEDLRKHFEYWKMYRSDVRHFEYSAQMQVDLNLRIIKQCMDNIRGGCSDDKEDFPMFMVASCRKDVVGHKAELACYGAERRHASNERRKVLSHMKQRAGYVADTDKSVQEDKALRSRKP